MSLFFFALLNSNNGSDYCSVFCLNIDCINEINSADANKEKKYSVKIVEPEDDFNKRIVNQSGLFLDIPIGVNFTQWIQNSPNYEFVVFEEIKISSKLRNDGLLMLNQMNINHNSLFPDLIGSAYDANLSLELKSHIEVMQNQAWDDEKNV